MIVPDDPYASPKKQENYELADTGSCLKVGLVWILPLFAVPLLVAICGGAWPVGVILAIGFLVWMGKIYVRESNNRLGANTFPLGGRVVIYVVLQLIWIPLFWTAIFWGFCSRTGHF